MKLTKLYLCYFLSDPALWNLDDAKSWLIWTINQYGLNTDLLQYFHMDGPALSALSENYFRQKSSIGGDILYAQLDIWKTGKCQAHVIYLTIKIIVLIIYPTFLGVPLPLLN